MKLAETGLKFDLIKDLYFENSSKKVSLITEFMKEIRKRLNIVRHF